MTKLEVINNGLMKAGLPLAVDLTEADYNALHVYDGTVETVLRANSWNFALRYASLERVENPRPFGPRYAYRLPADFISAVDVRKDTHQHAPIAEHEVAGGLLYCNVAPCNLRYTARVAESDWPADFRDAVSTLLASRIAGLSAEKMSLVPSLLQYYNLALSSAVAADARGKTARVPQENPFQKARQTKGE